MTISCPFLNNPLTDAFLKSFGNVEKSTLGNFLEIVQVYTGAIQYFATKKIISAWIGYRYLRSNRKALEIILIL